MYLRKFHCTPRMHIWSNYSACIEYWSTYIQNEIRAFCRNTSNTNPTYSQPQQTIHGILQYLFSFKCQKIKN